MSTRVMHFAKGLPILRWPLVKRLLDIVEAESLPFLRNSAFLIRDDRRGLNRWLSILVDCRPQLPA